MSSETADKIPMLDLRPEVEEHWDELMEAIQGVLRSTQFILGPNVKAFEEEFAAYIGVNHAIGVNSGTDALVIALRAMGIGPGDEVITTPFTFFATAESISNVGATPVFVDIEEDTFNINPELIEAAITEKTEAILPVHLFGHPAEMNRIMEIGQENNLKVLEDCAQATGAEYWGKKVGSIGDSAAFSFFPSKNLGAYGDGGMITTNDDDVARLARSLRHHGAGVAGKYSNERFGYNSRLDEMQAAILRAKLRRLDAANQSRQLVANRYAARLMRADLVTTPITRHGMTHALHQYTVLVGGGQRDEVASKLAVDGVQTMLYYGIPQHMLPVFSGRGATFRVAEQASMAVLSLPIWPNMPSSAQSRVIEHFLRALDE